MFPLLFVVGAILAAPAGSFARAQLDIRHEKSHRHTLLAALADTDRRPPGALLAVRAGRLRAPGDFGLGIAVSCGCAPVDRSRPMPGRCCLPDPVQVLPPACSTGGCS